MSLLELQAMGGFAVSRVDGGHRTMWEPPHVASLASALAPPDQPNDVPNRLS